MELSKSLIIFNGDISPEIINPSEMRIIMLLVFLAVMNNIMFAQNIRLTHKGRSDYTIVIPQKASLIEIQAAKVLQDYINRISDVILPITDDQQKPATHEVLIGKVNRTVTQNIHYDELGVDGILIKTFDNHLLITGGTKKGVIYGVYTFLENYLGCRKYTSTLTHIPRKKTIRLSAINDKQLPAFSF